MGTLTLTNARIYTLESGSLLASALVIQDGIITRVLSGQEGENLSSAGNTLDMEGRVILPGLIDSHLHLRHYAESLEKINCETTTRAACLERVAERVAATPAGEWILGHGWNHNSWPEGYGSAADLDQIAPDHPVYLTGKSLHVSWANSKALNLAGIQVGTPDPSGGTIQRDGQGKLTGILLENAVKLIEKIIPASSLEQTKNGILKAQKFLWAMGLTGVHDFDRELCLQALLALNDQGRLGLRVVKSIPSEYLDRAIELGYRTGEGDDWLWFGGVKDFADGALGPNTASMLEPFQGTKNLGLALLSEDALYELGAKAAGGGLALAIHAIGDRANRTVLNALERLRADEKTSGSAPLPHRIEHVQLIHPDDVGRLAALNITASMQPIHATSDMDMANTFWGDLTAYAYAPKWQFDQGARVVFGSDAPVESPNPWWGIHAAVTRQRADGSPGPGGWHPEGRVSLEQALQAFTVNPASSAGRENQQGKLAPGFWADLIVLDMDPFSCPPERLWEIKPVQTMVNGTWVYEC